MTGPDRTYYPAASPVKKDFDNIFSVYTDAVFSPLLRKESFMQEGIRFSSEGELHFEGVVFSEMQGDISQHESVVASAASRPLFDKDSPYRHEFGGNPPNICDLTYEEFINTYKKHYVPANMTLFFYGDLDLEEKLLYLDGEYLSKRDGGEKIARPELTTRWNDRKVVRETSNAEEGNTSSTVMLSWLLPGAEDARLNTELSLIVDLLLGNPGSPLYKAIVESGLGRDLSSESGMSDSYRELLFSVGISGADEKDAERIEEFILSPLRNIAKEGLSKMSIEASLRRMEFRLKEIPSGISQGYSLFFSRIDKGWAYGKTPADMLSPKAIIDAIRKSLAEDERYLESWIEKYFIYN
jgi:Zn-dependent M16 (insulinase) family peptidase